MKRIYLDHNASTPLDPVVSREMIRAFEVFGNPSSIHTEGRDARALVDDARVELGALLQCDHRQIVFTSGGTESNNLAILGVARANRSKGKHIVTSAIEHSAVLNACHQLEKEGFEITFLAPSAGGMISLESISDAIRPDTILISIMLANNEVGTIQSVKEIAQLARGRNALMHTDAVQALGKIPVDLSELGVDLLSVSAHKIYGPKGAGALYFAPGTELTPLSRGGSHERGLRAGTENVQAIHGFGTAARILREQGLPNLLDHRMRIEKGLSGTSMKIICKDSLRLPNTVNFYSTSWLGESMVMAFDLEGISVSNGSACSSGIIEPSHVVMALGYNEDVARSVIRISVGKFTTTDEIDFFLRVVRDFESIGTGVAT